MKNTFTKIVIAAVALSAVSVTFTACKKGEDDPFLSLRSRKARVAGEWKVTSMKSTSTNTDASGTETWTTTQDGSTYTTTYTDASGTTTTSGTETTEYTFEKDGTYSNTDNTDGDISTESGRWNFTSGVGDMKNKSQITLCTQSYNSTGWTSTSTGNYAYISFDLKELRNKKMVWYYKDSQTYTGGNSSTDEYEITFEPK